MVTMVSALNKIWGPSPKLTKWITTAITRTRLAYAAIAWGHSITQKYKLERLKKINALASKMMTPIRKKTPLIALEVINDLMPLELYIQEIALNTYCRLKMSDRAKWTNRTFKNKNFIPHLKYWKQEATNALGHYETTKPPQP